LHSLTVGIMQGIADAFSKSNQNFSLGVSQGGQLSFQQEQAETSGGAISGAGKGLDRIAQFYLDQAEGMFPVIEINAGRQVDLILTDEVKVKLPGETSQ
jgi:conjugal transfer pilus assembly protein TraB